MKRVSLVGSDFIGTGRRGGIRINDQYRVCFSWSDGDTFDVEITDYHS